MVNVGQVIFLQVYGPSPKLEGKNLIVRNLIMRPAFPNTDQTSWYNNK